MLKETFYNLLKTYTKDIVLIEKFWLEIELNYSNKKRQYHTLLHLDNLLNQLIAIKDEIKDWNTILFTLFYHDIIYNSLKSNNEKQSAKLAALSMQQLKIPDLVIEKCKAQILATIKHALNIDSDTNFFIDADLSVLGQDNKTYCKYYQDVRKEYLIYPDFVYKPGRKKVLRNFLKMESIYKTVYFRTKFEIQAKLNLQHELNFL